MQALLLSFLGLVVALVLLAGPLALGVALGGRRRRHRKMRVIESRLLVLERELAAAASGPVQAAAASPAASETAAETMPAPPAAPRLDLESLIAGRWLNRIGVLAVLLAAAFFLRFGFENQWVGPLGRVAIGLVSGAALLVASQWLLDRGMRYFSEGIAGLGAGVLFLSLYAAWDFYELIPELAALAGMIAVTGALVALALGRKSQRLAVLAI